MTGVARAAGLLGQSVSLAQWCTVVRPTVPGRAASVIVERSSPRCSELTTTTSAATSSVVTLLATLSELASTLLLLASPASLVNDERAVKFSRPPLTLPR